MAPRCTSRGRHHATEWAPIWRVGAHTCAPECALREDLMAVFARPYGPAVTRLGYGFAWSFARTRSWQERFKQHGETDDVRRTLAISPGSVTSKHG